MTKMKKIAGKVILALATAVILIFSFMPLYATVIVSLTPAGKVMEPMVYPKYFVILNFVNVFRYIVRPMLNSLFYAICSVPLVLSISIPAAYVLSRYRFKGRKKIMFILLFTQMLAGIVLMPAIYNIFVRLGIINSVPVLIFIYVSVNLSLSVWLLISFFSSVPVSIEESAIIEGAGRLQLIYRVAVPVIKPGIAVSAIFIFINTYNEFVIPLFLVSSPKYQTVTQTLNSFLTATILEWQVLAAGAIIAMIPPLAGFLFFQKDIIAGAAAGAVKG